MIKIFLTEDETVIRNGIKNGIDWEANGFAFVGEAADGELAYPLIKEMKPDILITDIKMPFMDGLELSATIKKELPNIKIIILSGHSDFQYAKQAINIGIAEYLLKPISSIKLLAAVKRIALEIAKERAENALKEHYIKEMHENMEFAKQKFFHRLITAELSMAEVLSEGAKLQLELGASRYCIILFKIMTKDYGMEYSEQVAEITQVIESLDKQWNIICFRRGLEGWAFLLKASNNDEMSTLIEAYCHALRDILKQSPEVGFFGGVGSIVERIRNIKDSYYHADKAFLHRFIAGSNQILNFHSLTDIEMQQLEAASLNSLDKGQENINKFLLSGIADEVWQFVYAYFDTLKENGLDSIMLRQYIVLDSYIKAMSFINTLGVPQETLEATCGKVKDTATCITSLEDTREYMIRLIKETLSLRDTISGRQKSDIILKAKEYIHENFMKEGLSLNSVASYANMSPSYFSTIFGQFEGKTFVEYVTSIRIDKAKELLICSSMKTSEIGYQVGYKDPHYFSYIFKKSQGCSPKEYREKRKG